MTYKVLGMRYIHYFDPNANTEWNHLVSDGASPEDKQAFIDEFYQYIGEKNLEEQRKGAWKYISKFIKKAESVRFEPGGLEEYLFSTHKSYSYEYASKVLQGRFVLGEPVIARDSAYSCEYARDVMKGRFELGEPIIATNPARSYYYADRILKGRFELGEPVIAKDGVLSVQYALNVVKGRFELGEPAIAKNGYASVMYAVDVLKAHFPAGERAIIKEYIGFDNHPIPANYISMLKDTGDPFYNVLVDISTAFHECKKTMKGMGTELLNFLSHSLHY